MSSEQTLERTNNTKYWAAFLFFILAVAASLIFFQQKKEIIVKPKITISDSGSQVNWFYFFKLPEIPLNDPDRTVVLTHLKEWITLFKNENFTFMSLSDVLLRQSQGKKVPAKSVVLYFSPGYRQSYESVFQIIEDANIPVTWLTDEFGFNHKDIRYINAHDIEISRKRSSFWDFGFLDQKKGNFSFITPRVLLDGKFSSGTISETESSALTVLNSSLNFNALSINSNWTAPDLMTYIYRNRKIDGPSYLSLQNVGDKPIAVSYPDTHPRQKDFLFDLSSRLDNRVHQVSWPTTANVHDYQVDLMVQDHVGEVWMTLRGNEGKGESVRLGFLNGFIVFDQEDIQFHHRRQTFPWKNTKAFSARVQIKANKLVFSVNEGALSRVYDLSSTSDLFEPISLMVFERVRGVAWANGIQLKITPINNSPDSL